MTGEYGYVGKILRVDLSSGSTTHMPIMDYADRFLGGRGVGTKIYWDEVSPDVKAFDPENQLIFVTGPLTAIPPAGSRWQIYGKSPATIPEQFCFCTLGGSWGAHLKFAGYDGVVIQGKSEKPVYLFIEDGVAEIRDASALWGKGTVEVRETLKRELGSQVRVVAIGPAGENMVVFANLMADNDASGSSGFGAVMGSKKLKAIAVRGSGKVAAANPGKLLELTKYVRESTRGIPEINMVTRPPKMTKDVCPACIGGCRRNIMEAEDGTKGKYTCGNGVFYQALAQRYYSYWTEVPFFANRLCDQYGVDIWPIFTMIMWMSRCYGHGILTDENTGIPLSKIGSFEFIEALVKKISLRDGFGDILAQGPLRAADSVGGGTNDLLAPFMGDTYGHPVVFDPRFLIYTGLIYAMEPRWSPGQLTEIGGIVESHWAQRANKIPGSYISSDVLRAIAKKFWGSELAVDFSTYEGKALAAKKVQDREFADDCLVLCAWLWPILQVRYSEDHVGDPTIESKMLSAATGKEVDEEGLYRIGERVFNLQRAVLAREGHRGRESDKLPELYYTEPLRWHSYNPRCLVPGKNGEVISRRGEVFDREKFERMKDEFYALREWDVATGLQTKAKLEELGLRDVAEGLAQRGLIV